VGVSQSESSCDATHSGISCDSLSPDIPAGQQPDGYKPNASREKPITQLIVYALALSRRTGLKLYDFVYAWFDEHHYFEFYPLHVVHKRLRRSNLKTSGNVSDQSATRM